MQEELRRHFRTRFIETARERVRKSVSLLGMPDGAKTLMIELHSLAGESALLGLKDISDAARSGELAAREWVEGDDSAKVRCVRLVRQVSRHVEAFAAEPPEAEPDTAKSTDKHRVMVIDDSLLAGEHIAESLEDNGMEARLTTDAASALAVIREFAPALVISDVNMPGVDLTVLCRDLREASSRPLRVVLLSGMAEAELAACAQKVGADDYIAKQRGIDAVVAYAKRVLEEAGD
jgi:CheY-like chemotaxis protein/HPt (histidine-containing phosphotransfer) domain-containing protein